jgi:Galactose oxidase-like, Early set domain
MSASRRLRVGLFLVMGAVLLGALSATSSLAVARVRPAGTPSQVGTWSLVAHNVPIRTPIHAALLRTGKVILAAGSGNDRTNAANHVYQTALWDPASGAYTNIDTPWDVFCAGQSQLPDGGVLFAGGTLVYSQGSVQFKGSRQAYRFDPIKEKYVRVQDMRAGRWYPTLVTLGSGRVFAMAGYDDTGSGNATVPELFDPATRTWAKLPDAGKWPLYPAMFDATGGKLLYTGGNVFGNVGKLPGIYDIQSSHLSPLAGLAHASERDQSTSVILPPAQQQRFMIMGGGDFNTGAVSSTSIVDLHQDNPAFFNGPSMKYARMHLNATLLPDRTVLVNGGGEMHESDPVFAAELYDPRRNAWRQVASQSVSRLYHSLALLLPDGRVLSAGGNQDGTWEQRMEIYSPPYLFKGTRPSITQAPTSIAYGSTITIQTTQTRQTKWVSLIRPAAVTHSLNTDQRVVNVPFTVDSGNALRLTVPAARWVAPPGWYMLFVSNTSGVPSVANWVHLG